MGVQKKKDFLLIWLNTHFNRTHKKCKLHHMHKYMYIHGAEHAYEGSECEANHKNRLHLNHVEVPAVVPQLLLLFDPLSFSHLSPLPF